MSHRGVRWIAAVVVIAALGGGSAAFVLANGDEKEQPKQTQPRDTAKVTKDDLAETKKATGTLGYADETKLSVEGEGLITWLPDEKSVLERGDTVVLVNDVPIVLFYGELPFYRTLKYGVSDGRDVKQLKENLYQLGLLPPGVIVDEEFTPGTKEAVKNFQEMLGVKETGVFDPKSVVVMPEAVRVGTPTEGVEVGSAATGELYTVSTKKREITTKLSPADARNVKVDDQADVTLPDGKVTTAIVTEIGTATADDEGNLEVPITLTLDQPKDVKQGAGVPVSLEFVTTITKNATTVPVLALIALAEGGYAVEVMNDDGTTTLVSVEPGAYANGRVEVDGDVKKGDEVVVPS